MPTLRPADVRKAVEAIDRLVSAYAMIIRTENLELTTDAGFRLIVKGIAKELFDDYASPAARDRLREDIRQDDETRAALAADRPPLVRARAPVRHRLPRRR